jgi:hypothetical protein
MEVKVYRDYTSPSSLDFKNGIEIAIRNKLYIQGWRMYDEFHRLLNTVSYDKKLAIAFVDNEPVACVLFFEYWDCLPQSMAFCKSHMRRRGYATACFKALEVKQTNAQIGISGSQLFWQSLEVKVPNHW